VKRSDLALTVLILAALVLGVVVGQFLLFDPSLTADKLDSIGKPWEEAGSLIFIRPLKMLIVPLVFVSVVVGVTSIGSPEKLGVLGGATLVYYITTMLLAIALGLTLVSTIAPGEGVEREALNLNEAGFEASREAIERGQETGLGDAFLNLLYQMLPENPVAAAAEGNTLGVVVTALLLGLALVLAGRAADPAVRVFEALFSAFLMLVRWILWLAPIGVFLLVAGKIGQVGLGQFAGPVGKYALVVLLGLAIHGAVTLPILAFLFGKANPGRFAWAIRKPLITAFSTASSSGTLPITIEEAQTSGKCSKRASNFVLPLGATINMDGTAGIPSAGLVTMAIVITAVNKSLASLGETVELPLAAIGIILGIDRILDMCRTMVNVWGDSIGARIMTRLAPDTEEELEKAAG